jgi:hypothetical protein
VRHNSRTCRQREARHGSRRAGLWPVQLRFECSLTGEEYVSQQAWRNASLTGCPLHPKGGCGLVRHGTYERLSPPGTLIARWYCPQGHRTFSLLPDCLAARLPDTLAELEALVGGVEQARSLEMACGDLRLEIELPGVLRWVRRRVAAIHAALHLLKGILPELFEGCEPTLGVFAARLGVDAVLVRLRQIAAPHLACLPAPLGFRPRRPCGGEPDRTHQHPAGPDPPVFVL